MMDWGQVLETASVWGPEAAAAGVVIWAIWLVRRMVRGVARLFRRGPKLPAVHATAALRPMRIEPVLGPMVASAVSSAEGAEIRGLKERIDVLIGRIDALEGRLAALVPPQGQGRTLRVVKSDEVSPA